MKKKAQSLGEYTVTISLVILAIMSMTYFMQRGFAARMNDARGYMLTALDDDIKYIHEKRGGTAYEGIRAEYEPYYVARTSETMSNAQSNVLIEGSTHTLRSQTLMAINSVSQELPAQDLILMEE